MDDNTRELMDRLMAQGGEVGAWAAEHGAEYVNQLVIFTAIQSGLLSILLLALVLAGAAAARYFVQQAFAELRSEKIYKDPVGYSILAAFMGGGTLGVLSMLCVSVATFLKATVAPYVLIVEHVRGLT